jgi:hypothetical protein
MFTLENAGMPIAITDAGGAEARAIFESDEFKQDLLTAVTSEGIPLWDGQAPLNIRAASREEIAALEAPDQDLDDGADDDEDDGLFVTFLVPVDHDHEET